MWLHHDVVIRQNSELVDVDLAEKLYNNFDGLVGNQLLSVCLLNSFVSSVVFYSYC